KPSTSPPPPASSRIIRTSPSSPATASTSCPSSPGRQRTSRHEASNSQGRCQRAPPLCHVRRERLYLLYCQGGEEGPHPGRGRRDLPLAHRPQPGLAGSRVCEEDELRGFLRARAEDEPVSLADHRRRMRRPRGGDRGADDARDPLPRQTHRRTRQGQSEGKDPPQIAARARKLARGEPRLPFPASMRPCSPIARPVVGDAWRRVCQQRPEDRRWRTAGSILYPTP